MVGSRKSRRCVKCIEAEQCSLASRFRHVRFGTTPITDSMRTMDDNLRLAYQARSFG